MKIAIIGPGGVSIPPVAWGAVEIIIWSYKIYLEERGVEVLIVNETHEHVVLHKVNEYKPDIVHIQYDGWWQIIDRFDCKCVLFTNHHAYLEQPQKRHQYPLECVARSNGIIHCLSEGVKNVYKDHGVNESRLFVLPNGADDRLIRYSTSALFPDKSIYLGKIETRKRQALYQNLMFIDFAGHCIDISFDVHRINYIGSWTKEVLYDSLTNYANLVLLSDGEVHPLVCCEALNAGLGLVLSVFACANLDVSKPFITIIPEDKINDIEYVANAIQENQRVSVTMRDEIRAYGNALFSWQVITDKYIDIVNTILKNNVE